LCYSNCCREIRGACVLVQSTTEELKKMGIKDIEVSSTVYLQLSAASSAFSAALVHLIEVAVEVQKSVEQRLKGALV
jgi:hypothetical protein